MNNIHIYTDNRGKQRQLTNHELKVGAVIARQLVKANGKVNWHRLRRMMITHGVDAKQLKVCRGLTNAIRHYDCRYLRHTDTDFNTHHKGKTIEADTDDVDMRAIKHEIGEYGYAKRESQDSVNEFNRVKRHLTDRAILRSQTLRALKQATFSYNIKNNERSLRTGDDVLVAGFADLHMGAHIDQPNNHYDVQKAKDRVAEYAKKLVHIALDDDVKDVYIANIGDMIEQVYMRFTQGFDTDLTLGEQVVKATDVVLGFLVYLYNHLSAKGVKLHYTAIAGNHDRINGNKKNNVYSDSVVVIMNSAVKRLAEYKFSPNFFEYIKPDSQYRTHLTVNHCPIKIVHGDLDNLNKPDTLGQFCLNDKRPYKVLFGGHLHRYSVMESGQNRYQITSGSFKGSDKYTDQLNKMSSVSQVAILVKPNSSVSIQNVELA